MKKLLCLLLCSVMIISICSGCASNITPDSNENSDLGFITITDHDGNSVKVPKDIQRIAVCGIYPMPSVLTIFFNSAEKIVAMPEASMAAAKNGLLGQLYPEILDAQTDCVSGETINTEELIKLNPDVVFYSASDKATGESLRAAGFNAVAISVNKWDYNCIETLNNWIELLSKIFPADDKSDAVKQYSSDVYNMVQERVSTLSDADKANIFVLFQYSDTTMLTSGQHFFGEWWCDAIGANNVAKELDNDNSSPVNLEQVYAWNPDLILITNFTKAQPDDIFNNNIGSDDWSGINAVINERVYKMPLGMYRSYTPGADTPITLLWLAKTVYPELFSDIDITAEAKNYYKEIFGVDLTEAQIESIFSPVSNAADGI